MNLGCMTAYVALRQPLLPQRDGSEQNHHCAIDNEQAD